jgi:hypothetical protein
MGAFLRFYGNYNAIVAIFQDQASDKIEFVVENSAVIQ